MTETRKRLILPRPDDFGNYWLGANRKEGPAIFPQKRLAGGATGKYVVLISTEQGFLFDGGKLREFDCVTSALNELRRMME